jgi:hypothetical protein
MRICGTGECVRVFSNSEVLVMIVTLGGECTAIIISERHKII